VGLTPDHTQVVDFSNYDTPPPLPRSIRASIQLDSIMRNRRLWVIRNCLCWRFRIFNDGTVVSEEPVLERSPAKTPAIGASMVRIRASQPV